MQAQLGRHAHDFLRFQLTGVQIEMPLPLLARKEALAEILKSQPVSSAVRYSDHWIGEGDRLYQEACRSGLEGVISKRTDQPYRPGRGRDWLKTKCIKSGTKINCPAEVAAP